MQHRDATPMQHTGLKGSAFKVLERNTATRRAATPGQKSVLHPLSFVSPLLQHDVAPQNSLAGGYEFNEESSRDTPAGWVSIPGADFPERAQCPACRGWLWWHSTHGALVCATCHPPAAPHLVKSWWWGNLPEAKQ